MTPMAKAPTRIRLSLRESPEHGAIGAEAVEAEIEEKKAKQKKAKEDLADEAAAKLEGEDKEKTGEEKLEYADQAAAEKAVKEAKKKMTDWLPQSLRSWKPLLQTFKSVWMKPPVRLRSQPPPKTHGMPNAKRLPMTPLPRPQPFRPLYHHRIGTIRSSIRSLPSTRTKMVEYNGKVAKVWADAQTEIARLAYRRSKKKLRKTRMPLYLRWTPLWKRLV